jgi:membrane-associated protein
MRMREFGSQLLDVFLNVFNAPVLIPILEKPEMMLAGFVGLSLIVFAETGLLLGFCLPGDSLLVMAGLVAVEAHWPVARLIVTLCCASILGDSIGFAIGVWTGPKIFNRDNSLFFRKSHLLAAHAFYERHGGKTIAFARFMPLVRTFAPVVAGVAHMPYVRFLVFSVAGGIGWVTSMTLIGYFLPTVIDPPFKSIFGPQFEVRDHIEKVIIVVVLLSLAPMAIAWYRSRRGGKPPGNHMKLVTTD